MVSSYRRVLQWATFSRVWWLYDAKYQCPFLSSPRIAHYLEGRHKPIFSTGSDVGDHVVVINTRDIAMEGEKWRSFFYEWNTGYANGKRRTRAYQMHEHDPTRVMYLEVKRAIKRHVRWHCLKRLHLYASEKDVPMEVWQNISRQIPSFTPVPKKLQDYSPQQLAAFPRVFDLPEDFLLTEEDSDEIKSSS